MFIFCIWILAGYLNIQFPHSDKKFKINNSVVKHSGILQKCDHLYVLLLKINPFLQSPLRN